VTGKKSKQIGTKLKMWGEEYRRNFLYFCGFYVMKKDRNRTSHKQVLNTDKKNLSKT
jgi:hypothetical protein